MERVLEARDRYLAERGFEVGAYRRREFPVRVGRLTLTFPNPGVLPFHDLHHVATGFATDLVGEAEISVYELRAGGAPALVKFLCVASILVALPLAPRRLARAWRRSRGSRSLYSRTPPYESLLALDVVELRAMLGLPENGISDPGGRS